MDIEDDVGAGENKVFVAAFESGSAEVFSGKIAVLQHGAHGSIEHKNAGSKGIFESAATIGAALLSGGRRHEWVQTTIVTGVCTR